MIDVAKIFENKTIVSMYLWYFSTNNCIFKITPDKIESLQV